MKQQITKIISAVQHSYNDKVCFLASYKYEVKDSTGPPKDIYINGILTQNIHTKKINKVLQYPANHQGLRGSLILDNRCKYQTKLYSIQHCTDIQGPHLIIKYIDANHKRMLSVMKYDDVYLGQESINMINRTESSYLTRDLVAFQDDNIIIFNFPKEMYFIYYKKNRRESLHVEKDEKCILSYEDRSSSGNQDEQEDDNEEEGSSSGDWQPFVPSMGKYKHLVCLISSRITLETKKMIDEANQKFKDKFKMISIDGADMIFIIENLQDMHKPIPSRVPFFTSIDQVVEGVFQIYYGLASQGSLTKYRLEQVMLKKKVLEFTKNDIFCWIRQIDKNVLFSNYFQGDKSFFIASQMNLTNGNYSSDYYCHQTISDAQLIQYVKENHREKYINTNFNKSYIIATFSKPTSRYCLFKVEDTIILCDHQNGKYLGSYSFYIDNNENKNDNSYGMFIVQFNDNLEIYIEILYGQNQNRDLVLLTKPKTNTKYLNAKLVYSRKFYFQQNESFNFSSFFLDTNDELKKIYFIDRVRYNNVIKIHRGILYTEISAEENRDQDKQQNYEIEELCEVYQRRYLQSDQNTLYPQPSGLEEQSRNLKTYVFFNIPSEQVFYFTETFQYMYFGVEWVGYDLETRLWSIWLLCPRYMKNHDLIYLSEMRKNDRDYQPGLVLAISRYLRSPSYRKEGRMFLFDKIAIQVISSNCFYDFLKRKYIERDQEQSLKHVFNQDDESLNEESIRDKDSFFYIIKYFMNLVFLDKNLVIHKLELQNVIQALKSSLLAKEFLYRLVPFVDGRTDEKDFYVRMFLKIFAYDVQILTENQILNIFY